MLWQYFPCGKQRRTQLSPSKNHQYPALSIDRRAPQQGRKHLGIGVAVTDAAGITLEGRQCPAGAGAEYPVGFAGVVAPLVEGMLKPLDFTATEGLLIRGGLAAQA